MLNVPMNEKYIPLHLKYRPQNFNTIVGHNKIIKYLELIIKNDKIGFAYLITGQHGSGKTTVARIIAKAINCTNQTIRPCNICNNCLSIHLGNSLDFYEIDGAKNTGIDNIREIIENLNFAPMVSKYKVCVIDEVHMLSNSAFNSLLKTLESPPKNTTFILLTTAINKLPNTVISRCQKFSLSPISNIDLSIAISKIAKSEKLKISNKGLKNLLHLAKGSFRDALNLLEIFILSKEAVTITSLDDQYLIPESKIVNKLVKKLFILNLSEALIIIQYIQSHNLDKREVINIMYSSLINEYIRNKKVNCHNTTFFTDVKTLNNLLKCLADNYSNTDKDSWNYFVSLIILNNRRKVKIVKKKKREKKVLYIAKNRISSN